MEIYENSYTEKEDKMMWEIHEIRHKLHIKRKNKTIEQINKEALEKYSKWLSEIRNRDEIR
ncbi:MAG: hypothetical protein HQK79_16245 [Desulfobacterales bacterium]|nr:hypothetical protein [Desulfobacterales bacterium]MBF0398770.1 hypothetical protein [Desulfobacterales bacterium]